LEAILQQTLLDRVLSLVTNALNDLEKGIVPLSAVIQKAIRIARLRNDHDGVWWLSFELIRPEDQEAKRDLFAEISPHYTKETARINNKRFAELLLEERTTAVVVPGPGQKPGEKTVVMVSVPELEARISNLRSIASDPSPPQTMHPFDVAAFTDEHATRRLESRAFIMQFESVLARVSQRVHMYLSRVEKELMFGQLNADIFERNRRYVDEHLALLAPDALTQLVSAYKRVSEGDVEARAQGLLSCRRVLKSLADALYPAKPDPVLGADGKSRVLTDDKFVARLWQFVWERLGGSASAKLLLATVNDIGGRLDALYKLSCKGAHSTVSLGEAEQTLINTYLLIGDLLRLQDQSSAAENAEKKADR
jgi:hypothetical protein